jgi:5-methylcytosine-specific restriction endonuclease McrA
MIREYLGRRLGAALLSLLTSCFFTKEELQEHADWAKKREDFKVWQQPDLRETSPHALFEVAPNDLRVGNVKVEPTDEVSDALWQSLESSQRRVFVMKAERNQRWNARKLAKFNGRIPLDPSIEKIPEREFSDIGLVSKSECLGLQRWNRYRRDHHKACGGSSVPVPKKPFRFLELPLELRQEVYRLVLSRKRQVFQFPPDGSAATTNGPVDVRIFAVSRVVYEESIPIFYQSNTFAIDVDSLPLFLQESTGNISPRPTALLRKVHVGLLLITPDSVLDHLIPNRSIEYHLTKQSTWAQLWSLLESCRRLMSVEITTYVTPSDKATHAVLTSRAEIEFICKQLQTARYNYNIGCANEEQVWVGRHSQSDWDEGLIRDVMGVTWKHAPPIALANCF